MHTVTIDDRLASFEMAGPSAAPRLILLHGFPMDRRLWQAVVGPLAESHCVYAVDLPGFGGSQRISETQTMVQMADWLSRFIDAAEIELPVRLCGLSMGGYIALEFAARHGDRLSHLVLCDTKTEADTDEARATRLALADSVIKTGLAPIADAMVPKLLAPANLAAADAGGPGAGAPAAGGPDTAQGSRAAHRLRQMILDCDPLSVAAASRGMAERRDTTGVIRNLQQPLLSIVGEADNLTSPAVMKRFTDLAPRGRLVTIPAAGHVCPLEQPQAFAAAVAAF